MTLETIYYVDRWGTGNSTAVPEMSTPEHEIDNDTAKKLISVLEAMGAKRCKHPDYFFYSYRINSTESVEKIFRA